MSVLQTEIVSDGITVAYRTARTYDPSKPTLVLLHSFLMDSTLYLPQFKDKAYDRYNLIAIDEHGHGGTKGREDFTFWSTAEDCLKLLRALNIPRFFVLGTSQGGFVALRMALLAPEQVQGLILLGTNADSESSENVKNFSAIRDKWCETEVPTAEALLGKSGSFGGPGVVGDEVYKQICETWVRRHAGPAGYDPALNCLSGRDSIVSRLSEIQTPALIMHGTSDKVYSVQSAQDWSKHLKSVWRFVIVDGGYHYLSFVSPGLEECRSTVPEFIESIASRPSR